MYSTITVCTISLLFRSTQGSNSTVNEGASTSGSQHQIDNAEKCEINSFVDNLLNSIADLRNRRNLNLQGYDSQLTQSRMSYILGIQDFLNLGP